MLPRTFRVFTKGRIRIPYKVPEQNCTCPFRSWRRYTTTTTVPPPSTPYTQSQIKDYEEAMQKLYNIGEHYSLSRSTVLKHMVDLVSDLQQAGQPLTPKMYQSLLRAYATANQSHKIMPLILEMESHGVAPSPKSLHKALRWAVDSPLLQAKLLDRMETYGHKRTAETYDMIIKCAAKNLEFERALDTLDEMKKLGIAPLDTTFMNVLVLAVEYNSPSIAFDILENMEALGKVPDPNWCMMALRCAAVYDHHTLIKKYWKPWTRDQGFHPDDGLCKSALLVAARSNDPQLAYDILFTVSELGYPYTDHHFTCLLESFASTADYKSVFRVFTAMRKAGITPTKTTATPVAQWLGKDTNAILQARQALTALRQHHEPVDRVAFNMLIHAFAYNDEFDEAMATFAMADELGITPDEDTLHALLDACIHQRNTQHGETLYRSFIRAGIKPTVVSLSKMVALMCTQDHFEDAFVYLEKIKKTGQLPLRGAYYRLIKKLSASNDPRLPMAIEDMEACGYSLSSHLDDYMDDKAFLHEKRERIRLKRMIAEAENIA